MHIGNVFLFQIGEKIKKCPYVSDEKAQQKHSSKMAIYPQNDEWGMENHFRFLGCAFFIYDYAFFHHDCALMWCDCAFFHGHYAFSVWG